MCHFSTVGLAPGISNSSFWYSVLSLKLKIDLGQKDSLRMAGMSTLVPGMWRELVPKLNARLLLSWRPTADRPTSEGGFCFEVMGFYFLLRRRAEGHWKQGKSASEKKSKDKRRIRMQERSSSIRLRRRRGEEGRQEFLKSRRSGEWSHRLAYMILASSFPLKITNCNKNKTSKSWGVAFIRLWFL